MLLYIYFRLYIHSPLHLPPALFMDRLLDGWPLGTETSAALFIIDRTAEQPYDFFQQICWGDTQQCRHQQRREIQCFSQALYFMTLLGFHTADYFLSNSPLCWILISSFIYTHSQKPLLPLNVSYSSFCASDSLYLHSFLLWAHFLTPMESHLQECRCAE